MRKVAIALISFLPWNGLNGAVFATSTASSEEETWLLPSITNDDHQHGRVLQSNTCFTDLDAINALEDSVPDLTVRRTYTLCPGTTFIMGTVGADGTAVGGFAPLRPRSNAVYRCGQTGQSSNRCILQGGDYAIFAIQPITADLTNVLIQGLTMASQARGGVVLARPGDITFTDCVIRNQENSGAVQLLYRGSGSTRHLNEEEQEQGEERQLQRRTLVAVFEGVLFLANTGVPTGLVGTTYPGIVTTISQDVTMVFQGCVFRDNVMSTPGVEGYTYAISTRGSLTLRNSCFEDNSFLQHAPVIVAGQLGSQIVGVGVYGTANLGSTLGCNFAARFPTLANLESGVGFSCVPFTSETCLANLVTPPTSSTTPAPVPAPAPAPVASASTPAPVVAVLPTLMPVAPGAGSTPAPVVAVVPTLMPVTAGGTPAPVVNADDCLPFASPCTVNDDCCSDRCVFDQCQRPAFDGSPRVKLSNGRGGVGGASKVSSGGSGGSSSGGNGISGSGGSMNRGPNRSDGEGGGGGRRNLLQQQENHHNHNHKDPHRSKSRIRGYQ